MTWVNNVRVRPFCKKKKHVTVFSSARHPQSDPHTRLDRLPALRKQVHVQLQHRSTNPHQSRPIQDHKPVHMEPASVVSEKHQ